MTSNRHHMSFPHRSFDICPHRDGANAKIARSKRAATNAVRSFRFRNGGAPGDCLAFAPMNILSNKVRRLAALVACLMSINPNAIAQSPASGVTGDELAVWNVMAATIASDNADRPYKLWYFKSDFSAANFISIAMSDPDREEFCGLTGPASQAMLEQLKAAGATPVVLEEETAEFAGFKLARKKNPRMRYFAMSRVVFNPAVDSAWLSIELNGERGSIARLDKVDGEWKRTSRCGAWYMPERNSIDQPMQIESRILGQRKR
jgi:hypothetical protein